MINKQKNHIYINMDMNVKETFIISIFDFDEKYFPIYFFNIYVYLCKCVNLNQYNLYINNMYIYFNKYVQHLFVKL